MSNLECVQSLEPSRVWQIFARMAEAPRPSKKEEKIKAVIHSIASEAGFEVKEDEVGNCLVMVPAKPGCEQAPTIVIQGHLDMVCEKNADTDHDFDNDPIHLELGKTSEGRAFVTARGTTLGADNGIGVAMGLAAALDPDVAHGPLELLMTIDEEAGMTGAQNLKPGFLSGKIMLNLDSEEDDALYVGCAGGCDITLDWDFKAAKPEGTVARRVTVKGLRGGHSGIDIHENRGNAGKLLARCLSEAGLDDLQILAGKGGSLRNAIPREAWMDVCGGADLEERLKEAAATVRDMATSTFGEKDCEILIEETESAQALSNGDSRALIQTLLALPSGVQAVVPEIPGEILSSNNAATFDIDFKDGACHVGMCCLARSADRLQLFHIVHQIRAIGSLAGAKLFHGNEYPGWQPNLDSPLLSTCRELYAEVFGQAPKISAIHAGLECGVINTSIGGGLDMISFGPTIEGAHSPDERVYVDSVEKIWRYFVQVLNQLAGR